MKPPTLFLVLLLAIAMLSLAFSSGPSDLEAAQDVADDLVAAKAQAVSEARRKP